MSFTVIADISWSATMGMKTPLASLMGCPRLLSMNIGRRTRVKGMPQPFTDSSMSLNWSPKIVLLTTVTTGRLTTTMWPALDSTAALIAA